MDANVILGLDFYTPPPEKGNTTFNEVVVNVDSGNGLDTLPNGKYTATFTAEENQAIAETITWVIDNELTECQRQVIRLKLGGKKQTEIAAELQLHQTTVSQHIIYAKKKIIRSIIAKFPSLVIKESYVDA